jgi:hypothetical protein
MQTFNALFDNNEVTVRLPCNHVLINSELMMEKDIDDIKTLLLQCASCIENEEAELLQLKEKIQSKKSRLETHWQNLKKIIVLKYPYSRLRDQDLLSFSAILRAHFVQTNKLCVDRKIQRWLWAVSNMLMSRLELIRQTVTFTHSAEEAAVSSEVAVRESAEAAAAVDESVKASARAAITVVESASAEAAVDTPSLTHSAEEAAVSSEVAVRESAEAAAAVDESVKASARAAITVVESASAEAAVDESAKAAAAVGSEVAAQVVAGDYVKAAAVESADVDECILIEKSKLLDLDPEARCFKVKFETSLLEEIPIPVYLAPTNKEWKITETMHISLRKYLISPYSHGQFYPPPIYWNIQKAFMEESGLIMRESSVPFANYKKLKDARGNGTFCGRQGICKGTQLVFMGLIYHGQFDLQAMKELWRECNKDDPNVAHRLPQDDFEGHIVEVQMNLFIIGHPGCATTMFNEHPIGYLNHCAIRDNLSAIIEFQESGFAFTEIFLNYCGKINMNRRMNVSVAKAVTDLVIEGDRFVAGKTSTETKKKSKFDEDEEKKFPVLQAENTLMPPSAKKRKIPPTIPLFSPVPCAQSDVGDQPAKKLSGSSSDRTFSESSGNLAPLSSLPHLTSERFRINSSSSDPSTYSTSLLPLPPPLHLPLKDALEDLTLKHDPLEHLSHEQLTEIGRRYGMMFTSKSNQFNSTMIPCKECIYFLIHSFVTLIANTINNRYDDWASSPFKQYKPRSSRNWQFLF